MIDEIFEMIIKEARSRKHLPLAQALITVMLDLDDRVAKAHDSLDPEHPLFPQLKPRRNP